MTLAAGSTLGPYEILGQIGAGGMGGPRLSREVAIKVLPASFSQDADRLQRFEQEDQAAGVLNHFDGGDPRPIPGLEPDERKTLWNEIVPADRTGLVRIETVSGTQDGKRYAYRSTTSRTRTCSSSGAGSRIPAA